ncbi:hypothetical protein [Pediococcus claussenii]|uniref:Uncharacterized protein n=1 Tax=Pediococcus claussenii (strain ATCC BAA-344 / DSM 14800 / JCM 18046 / KCTC 3811 / LMG 21948 / P06) TaxID=701521 RepID=G8PBE0_PEDCP|nr:hypothetical protein [Pediococcus claussenii]AEV95929.1 hypothetical protein PECL_1712 [Pediococcus claussenii ATCC BAA-344]ANZ69419.1 hypothetical protein AYR57_03450 [Pediococcus claussenii]ANZ71239.1 hypothetical protein AYR58_03465 [Pediococcus claussenii]KRN20534.1 hypothetical protein IV79_GL000591 [Pediococcus claussenii]
MSKHKRKNISTEEKVEKATAQIKAQQHTALTIADLPKWMQGAAYSRFMWVQWIAFIPLVLVALSAPMLQNKIPASLAASAPMLNKNVLFIVPFACLIVAYGCWLSIKFHRQGEHITDKKRFSIMEIQTFFGDIIVVSLCTVISIYQVFVAFH